MAEVWDYMVANFIYGFTQEDFRTKMRMTVNGSTSEVPSVQAGLQLCGDKGWELVTITESGDSGHQYWSAYFKRRKP
jgi:hypothetical protein